MLLTRQKAPFGFNRLAWVCPRCQPRQRLVRRSLHQSRDSLARLNLAEFPDNQTVGKRRKRDELPRYPTRTRFAPSPTGFMHLGSLRTALYNYLLAKSTNGKFVLRIEDTDTKRTVPGAEQRILDDLRWAGLEWDEGPDKDGPHGPYRQSERNAIYQKHADQLVEHGHAYRCFCTPERLHSVATKRAEQGLPADYDRACFEIPKEESDDRAHKGEKFTVRLIAPEVPPVYHDLVYGDIGKPPKNAKPSIRPTSFEDMILLKSDGFPTYHLANVVDDHDMKISHVIRGVEWMPSTSKHVALYNAFGWQPPIFAHVGLLTTTDQQKLSKRNQDSDLNFYRDSGIHPEALVNYLALLGWSHSRAGDFWPLQALVENFSTKFSKGNIIVTPTKLRFLQKKWSAQLYKEPERRAAMIDGYVKYMIKHDMHQNLPEHMSPDRFVTALMDHNFQTLTTPDEFFNDIKPLLITHFGAPSTKVLTFLSTTDEPLKPEDMPARQDQVRHFLDVAIKVFEDRRVGWREQILKQAIENLDVGPGFRNLAAENKARHKLMRWAILDGAFGVSMATTMFVLGRKECLFRLRSTADAMRYWRPPTAEEIAQAEQAQAEESKGKKSKTEEVMEA